MEALHQKYKDQNVKVFVIDVMESQEITQAWAIGRHQFSFPILLDGDGLVSASFAPADVLPDLPRYEVPIASNLIIGTDGTIQFYSLLDSKNFDAKLIALQAKLVQLMAE